MLGQYLGAGASTTKLLLHLNGNSTDSSGNGNNGTSTNITYSLANGKFGQGAGFNGSSSKITIPSNSSLNFGSGNRTINVWMKTSATTEGRLYNNRNNSSTWWSLGYNYTAASTPSINFEAANAYPSKYKLFSSPAINNGTYNLYTLVISGSNLSIYVNASLGASDTWTPFSTDGANTTNYIGAYADGSTFAELFNGSIDELILENRAWSAQEVAKYYTHTKGRFGII